MQIQYFTRQKTNFGLYKDKNFALSVSMLEQDQTKVNSEFSMAFYLAKSMQQNVKSLVLDVC